MDNPILVEALRGEAVESFHRGRVAVVNDRGELLLHHGDIDSPVFPRSAVKLLQALPLVGSGAAEALGLTDAELALACASHGGEPRHVEVAVAMLGKAGLGPEALECGAHWPSHEASSRALGAPPTALHNNCSGKHAGFLCLGGLLARQGGSGHGGSGLRGFLSGYVEPEHPVMQAVSAALARSTDTDLSQAPRGTDGCSIPTFAIPLRQLALAFARVGSGHGLGRDDAEAALRLRRAIAREPFMVAGTGRVDTRVMTLLGERVCCKVGAEGVYCASLPEWGWGVAIKMDDGNNSRAVEVVMVALLQALLGGVRGSRLSPGQQQELAALSHPVLRNWQGREVGRLQPQAAWLRRLNDLAHSL